MAAMTPERIGTLRAAAEMKLKARSIGSTEKYQAETTLDCLDEIERLRGLLERLDRIDDLCRQPGDVANIIREALEPSEVPQ